MTTRAENASKAQKARHVAAEELITRHFAEYAELEQRARIANGLPPEATSYAAKLTAEIRALRAKLYERENPSEE